jgi:hypothetical protein
MLWHLIGLAGMFIVVSAYWRLTDGKLKSSDKQYHLLNLTGAILLIVSLLFNFNLGSFVIEVFWIIIAVKGLIRVNN